jgi:hypothetical protein
MTEDVRAPIAVFGLVLRDDHVVEAAPIAKYTLDEGGWDEKRVRSWSRGWELLGQASDLGFVSRTARVGRAVSDPSLTPGRGPSANATDAVAGTRMTEDVRAPIADRLLPEIVTPHLASPPARTRQTSSIRSAAGG